MTRRQRQRRALTHVEAELRHAVAHEVSEAALHALYRRRRSLVASIRFPVWKVRVYEWLKTGANGRLLACLELAAPDQRMAVRNAMIRYERIYGVGAAMKLTATASQEKNRREG